MAEKPTTAAHAMGDASKPMADTVISETTLSTALVSANPTSRTGLHRRSAGGFGPAFYSITPRLDAGQCERGPVRSAGAPRPVNPSSSR